MINKHEIDSDEYYNPEFYKYASYEITSEYYPYIGELISLFNSLDNSLNECLIDFINNENVDIGLIVISDLSFSNKMRIWKKLVMWYLSKIKNKSLQTHLIKKLEEIYKELADKASIRNTIGHADWENMNEKLFVKSKTKSGKDGIKHYFYFHK